MNKKTCTVLVILLVSALLLSAFGCSQGQAPAENPAPADPATEAPTEGTKEEEPVPADPIKIGVIQPFEGGGAIFGLKAQQGIELGLKKVNAEGGINGRMIEFVYMDDKGDATESVNAYNKIAEDVAMIIGPGFTGCALAVAPLAEEDNKICITHSATNPAVTKAGETFFRSSFKDDDYGTAMARYAANNLNLSKFALLYNSGDDYSVGLADAFTAEAGDKVVIAEAYGPNDVDFKTQLTKIKAADVDTIFLPGIYSFTAPIIMQMQELDMLGIQIMGADALGILKAIPDPSAAEGMVVCDGFPIDNPNPMVQEFIKEFQDTYGEMPDQFPALALDAFTMCVEALRSAESMEGDDLLKAMRAVEVEGLTGYLSFDDNGDQKEMNFTFQYVENGELKTFS